MSRYPVPAGPARVEETISRSRFITSAAAAPSVEAARRFIARTRAEYADATHNCYAFLVGPPGSTAQVGMSDDGEPAGTAGRPMLAVVLGSGAGDLVVVVTRYFGGTKLGTGGLVRAYSGGVKAVLARLTLTEKIAYARLTVRGPYRWITPFTRLLPEYEARSLGQEFGGEVTWIVEVPEERAEDLARALIELSHNELRTVL